MYVISLARWRRRFGPWVRTFLIAVAVLVVLFTVYRWFWPVAPVGTPFHPDVFQATPGSAGEAAVDAERIAQRTGISTTAVRHPGISRYVSDAFPMVVFNLEG